MQRTFCEAKDVSRADFVVEGDLEAWRGIIASIARGEGRPDLAHTLNHLDAAGDADAGLAPIIRCAAINSSASTRELAGVFQRIVGAAYVPRGQVRHGSPNRSLLLPR